MKEFKGTPGPWVADIRGGCAAIYPSCRTDDTPGCHYDDDRNITFSSKVPNTTGCTERLMAVLSMILI